MNQSRIVHAAFDETGDTGDGSSASRYLVVAGIVTDNLEPLRKAVAHARKSLGKKLRDVSELKAWHTPPKITRKLLHRVAALDVEIYAAILDKQQAKRPKDGEDWYRQVCLLAVQQVLFSHDHVILTFDRRYTNPTLRDRLTEFIVAGAAKPGQTLSFIHADSQRERALQAADAVAWSLFQKYERGDETFYRLLEARVKSEVVLRR